MRLVLEICPLAIVEQRACPRLKRDAFHREIRRQRIGAVARIVLGRGVDELRAVGSAAFPVAYIIGRPREADAPVRSSRRGSALRQVAKLRSGIPWRDEAHGGAAGEQQYETRASHHRLGPTIRAGSRLLSWHR